MSSEKRNRISAEFIRAIWITPSLSQKAPGPLRQGTEISCLFPRQPSSIADDFRVTVVPLDFSGTFWLREGLTQRGLLEVQFVRPKEGLSDLRRWHLPVARETSQSRLAASLHPPRKAPYVSPIVLWLVGCFPVLSLIVNEIRGPLKGIIALAYLLLLPVWFLAALFYNVLVRPKKLHLWEQDYICLSCGSITPPHWFS